MIKEKLIREGIKLATSGSVITMIGGITAAVLPKTICIPYKIATWIGTYVVASFVSDKLDDYVEDKIDTTKEDIQEIKAEFEKVKKNIEEEIGA